MKTKTKNRKEVYKNLLAKIWLVCCIIFLSAAIFWLFFFLHIEEPGSIFPKGMLFTITIIYIFLLWPFCITWLKKIGQFITKIISKRNWIKIKNIQKDHLYIFYEHDKNLVNHHNYYRSVDKSKAIKIYFIYQNIKGFIQGLWYLFLFFFLPYILLIVLPSYSSSTLYELFTYCYPIYIILFFYTVSFLYCFHYPKNQYHLSLNSYKYHSNKNTIFFY